MAKLPRKVKVGALTFDTSFNKDLDEDVYGRVHRRLLKIELNPLHQEVQGGSTLLHEVLHAIFLDRNLDKYTTDEESIVRHMESGLMAFFRDNPQATQFILDGVHNGKK